MYISRFAEFTYSRSKEYKVVIPKQLVVNYYNYVGDIKNVTPEDIRRDIDGDKFNISTIQFYQQNQEDIIRFIRDVATLSKETKVEFLTCLAKSINYKIKRFLAGEFKHDGEYIENNLLMRIMVGYLGDIINSYWEEWCANK